MPKNKTVGKLIFTLFVLFAGISLGYAESCSVKGQTQYKYTANGCSYITQVRTCCSNGSWSAWDKPCPMDECKNGKTKDCGSGGCGQKICKNGRWSACETKQNRLGSTAYYHDTYCTTGGHSVWCSAYIWNETLKCCALSVQGFNPLVWQGGTRLDPSKCADGYCCLKSEYIYPNTNVGRLDWGDDGAVKYIK